MSEMKSSMELENSQDWFCYLCVDFYPSFLSNILFRFNCWCTNVWIVNLKTSEAPKTSLGLSEAGQCRHYHFEQGARPSQRAQGRSARVLGSGC